MASIDERIVSISFENSRFEANVAATMATLGKLDKSIADIGKVNGLASIEGSANKVTLTGPMSALDKLRQKLGMTNAGTTFSDMEKASDKVTLEAPMSALDKLKTKLGLTNAGTTFTDMERAADRISFSGLTRAIDGIGSHMTTMSTAVSVALGGLAAQVAQKGATMVKSLALDPIIGGFQEYQTNLGSIQTILANTKDSGGNLTTVNDALNQLNKYSDQTIYNFGQMAKNIGTFTAAGVQLKPAVESIKGIANLAALSGSNSEQASTAMYQLSQAIASGRVGLQDWNSVVNAGMGGAVFQKALMRTAENMGTVEKGAVKIDKATGKATLNGKSFRESITAKPGEKSWLTSDVLTKTLGQFTGDLTDAQLHAQGFNDAQIAAIQSTAKSAKQAATQVKSLPQVFDIAKETIGSGWAKTFQTIFGNFGEAKGTFTSLSNTINGFINTNSNARNKVLDDWKKLGGRAVLIDGIKNAFKALMDVVKPIRDAFRNIFPPETGKGLFDLTTRFRDLMKHLQASPETMDKIKRTFQGFFAILHIGWTVIKTVVGFIGQLLGASKGAAGGILGLTATVGDFFTNLDKAISSGQGFGAVFGRLKGVIQGPLNLIKALAGAIKSLFSGKDSTGGASKFSGAMSTLRTALGPLGGLLDGASKAWHGFLGVLDKVKTAISPLLENIAHVFSNFGQIVSDGIKNADYGKVFSAVQTVLVGGIFLAIKKALGGGLNIDFGGGALKSLNTMLGTLTGNLKALQKNIQAHTLLAIAAAIGILAVGVALLSRIDPKKLGKALTAVAIGMGELVGAMAILTHMGKGALVASASMVVLATAMTVMAVAVKLFSTMSWDELARGLAGMAGALTTVSLATQLMDGPKLLVTAAALTPLAIGINILALAVKIFATMSWEQMGKGLAGLAGSLTVLGLAMKLMPPSMPLIGAGLIAVSVGLILLSGAVLAFGHMKIETLAKGILAMGVALVVIGLAMDAFPPTLGLQAAALVLVAAAMTVLAGAIALLGNMKIQTLVTGIVAMGAALVVLALGLDAMTGSLAGSAALVLAAVGLALLVPTLGLLGSMSWGVILKGLGAIAVTLGVLAVVGALASGPLIALGIAIGVLGLGLAAVGAAVYLFAKGISLIGDKSAKAVAALIAATAAFITVFPTLFINFIKGIISILGSVVQLAPKIIAALVSIAVLLLDAIIKLTPKIAYVIGVLITNIIKVINTNAGPIIAAGFSLLLKLLSGIASNIGQIATTVGTIITNFLNALATSAPRIIQAGVNLLVSFLKGITDHIPKVGGAVGRMLTAFLNTVANNVPKVVAAGGNLVAKFLTAIANQVPKMVSAGTTIIVNFITGIGNASARIVKAATDAAGKFIKALAKGLVKLVNTGFDAIIDFLNGIAKAIRNHRKRLVDAGWNVANAIIDGMISGLGQLSGKFLSKVGSLAGKAVHAFTHPWEIFSPSHVTQRLGQNVMLGMIKGLEDNAGGVNKTLEDSAHSSIKTVKSAFSKLPDAIDASIDANPVITPVLDLTGVKRDASTLSDLMPSSVIAATTSSDQAATISDQKTAVDAAAAAAPVSATTVSFEQNNYSPDPIPNIEIYRQTKNQIAQIKSLVGVN